MASTPRELCTDSECRPNALSDTCACRWVYKLLPAAVGAGMHTAVGPHQPGQRDESAPPDDRDRTLRLMAPGAH